MERLIDPAIADLQHEYAEARRHDRVWRSRWIRLAGYAGFWKVLAVCAASQAVPAMRDWAAADDRAIARTMMFSLLTIAAVTGLLMLVPIREAIHVADDGRAYLPVTRDELGWLIVYVIPQGLPLGIIIGVPFGILCALRGRVLSARSRRGAAALAIVGALGAWFTQNTLAPASNHAFRQLVAHRSILARGVNELSLSELSARIDAVDRHGRDADARPLRFSFYIRWVASVAPLVLGLFAIAVCSAIKTPRKSMTIGFAVTIAYIAFYTVLTLPRYWSATSRVPPFALAWIPNVAVVLLAMVLFLRNSDPAAAGHHSGSSSRSG
jgi:hypothetical protein